MQALSEVQRSSPKTAALCYLNHSQLVFDKVQRFSTLRGENRPVTSPHLKNWLFVEAALHPTLRW